MNKKLLYALWGCLFILCAGLGFIPEPQGGIRTVFTILSIAFFLPPALILYRGKTAGDRNGIKLIRNLAGASLLLTLVTLVLNVVCAVQSEFLGNFLHGVLIIVSAPMVCSGYWVLSLFLWACLLMTSLHLLKE